MALNIIPTAGQTLNETRDPIRNNFTYIDNGVSQDHIALNTTGAGKHNQVTLPVQTGAPTFAAGENGIYNRTLTANEVYLHKQYYGGTHEIPMTNSTISTTARSTGELAYTYLPSGIILQWGTWNTATSYTVTLPIAFPNALLNVQLTPYFSGTGVTNALILWVPGGTSTTQFTVGSTVNGTQTPAIFSFLAIGY